MIYIRLTYCAIILLVLLFVGSAMGVGEPYRFFASSAQSDVCLSLRHRKTLTACCNETDPMQMIHVTTTGVSKGIFHTIEGNRILCYDTRRGRFKAMKRSAFKGIERCRHPKSRRKHKNKTNPGRTKDCIFTNSDKEFFKNTKSNIQCIFHEKLMQSGFYYISVEEDAKYLAVKKGRVQKIKKNGEIKEPREPLRQFIIMDKDEISKVSSKNGKCRAHVKTEEAVPLK